MDTITSISNTKIKKYTKLLQKKYRNKESMFIVEGFHLVEEAKKAGIIMEIITSDSKNEGTLVTPEIIKKLSTTVTPQQIIAICKKKSVELKGDKILVLDNVQDPGNVGTLIRSARAFNWDGVLVLGADIYSPKVIRASQGSIFSIPVVQATDLITETKQLNLPIVGSLLDKKAQNYKDVKVNKLALVVGNEGKGISENMKALLKHKIYIPIQFESLNAGVAGSILMNEYK